MTINLNAPQMTELKPRIVVIGVGGAGGNAVNNMISSGLDGVDFIVANTDSQSLAQSTAERRIQLGTSITQGLGCGARPDVGRAAAEEAIDQILDHMGGTHMAFITAGMGGGTGTGAAPVIAEALREQGILTVGVVTKPFQFEGGQRLLTAEKGLEELQAFVDTLIIIPNQNLFRVANEKTTFADAFAMADDVLHSGVRGITDLMVMPGLINLDFADVKTVMAEMGKAMMGTGEAEGEKRAIEAAEAAISNPLLDDVSMKGARGVLINITGGMDLTLYEVDEAANRIREEVDPDANIIVGSALEDTLNGRMRVSVVATGIEVEASAQRPVIATPRLAAVAGRPVPGDAAAPDGADATTAVGGGADEAPAEAPAAVAEKAVADPAPQAIALSLPDEAVLEDDTVTAAPEEAPLPLAIGQAVPTPKPPQAEPEPVVARSRAKVEPQLGNEPFIAPTPSRPEEDRTPLRRPDPLAEADVVNAGSRPPKEKKGGFSLFRRMTGSRSAEAPAPKAAEPAKPRVESPPPERVRQATAPTAPEPTPEAAAPVPAEPAAQPREEEDLLEIPSFLRRQAN